MCPSSQPTALENYRQEVEAHVKRFTVFLCGPSLRGKNRQEPPALLRRHLQDSLKDAGFDVVLGEDEGLNNPILNLLPNAQDNEYRFISNHCDAIILIASSPGSFCELGLFSHAKVHNASLNHHMDFILLIDKKFRRHRSYLNKGPAAAISVNGLLLYRNFENFKDTERIMQRLNERRSLKTFRAMSD